MYYNVVIKDEIEENISQNQLVFHFENNYDEAIKFLNYIITISDFHVEFLQFHEENQEEE